MPCGSTNIDSDVDLFESPCDSTVSDDIENNDPMFEAYCFMPGERDDYNVMKSKSQSDDGKNEFEEKMTYFELLIENQKLKNEIIRLKLKV